jgi:hypothetical protein
LTSSQAERPPLTFELLAGEPYPARNIRRPADEGP